MSTRLLLAAFFAAAALALQDLSVGHGGTYRGPGDTSPPGGGGGTGGGAPATPGASGPSQPGPGASTPLGGGNVPTPLGAPNGPTSVVTGGAAFPTTDLTTWQFWWGFNKEPYLNLREHLYASGVQTGDDEFWIGRGARELARDTLRPSEETIRSEVVPALLAALERERQNDIVTGCLIALAKIGDAKDERGASQFQQVIQGFLEDSVQEISETAAIALGILANDASVELLTDLMLDRPRGRGAVGSASVPYRTRAFAAYGLGLIGHRTEDNTVRRAIAQSLIEVLELPRQATRDLKVAALASLGLVPVDPGPAPAVPAADEREPRYDSAAWASTQELQVRYLLELFEDETEHYLVRAHAPRALARLAPTDGEGGAGLRAAIVDALLAAAAPHSREENEVLQSAVLALGQLGDCDADAHDVAIRKTLRARIGATGDQQTKHFAVIALAQVGSRPGRNEPDAGYADLKQHLLRMLARSGKGRLKPWVGLGLGVMQHHRTQATGGLPDADVSHALLAALADCRAPMDVGAYCIGVGVARQQEAASTVLGVLQGFADDEARGYAAVALGLMDARDAIEPIQAVVRDSKYRPELLKQAAIALGLLGDRELVGSLVSMLGNARGLSTQAAISSALGFIGDAHSIEPLVAMLEDEDITATARGFAAVALGIVADKEMLPWNAKLSVDINYRANTTTLTGDNGTGILDIL